MLTAFHSQLGSSYYFRIPLNFTLVFSLIIKGYLEVIPVPLFVHCCPKHFEKVLILA